MGKGSNPRPVDATKYRANWERIFARHVCPTCGGEEGWEDHWDRDGLLVAVWVPCPRCQTREDVALNELTQLSQDMGMFPQVIDESKDRA